MSKKAKIITLSLENDFENATRFGVSCKYNKEYNIELYELDKYNEYRLMSHYCLNIAKSNLVRYVMSNAKHESRRHRYNVKNTTKSIKVVID